MKKRFWTPKELDTLLKMTVQGKTNEEMAAALGRTASAVAHKRSELGVIDSRLDELKEEREPERPVPDIEKALAGLEAIREELRIATESLNILKAQHEETESALKTMRGLIDDHRDVIAALRQDITDVSAYLSRSALHRAAHRFHCPYEDGRGGV